MIGEGGMQLVDAGFGWSGGMERVCYAMSWQWVVFFCSFFVFP
jgi:hypothetical protein